MTLLSSARNSGFANSKYQSQNVPHVKLYIDEAASLNLNFSKLNSNSAVVMNNLLIIQEFIGWEQLLGLNSLLKEQLLNSQNLAAFHNLVAKFL